MHDTQDKAAVFAGLFETRKRINGDTFYCLADNAPEWARDIVHDCHGDMMPDDWRYRFMAQCADALSEGGDDTGEIADNLVSVYTSELFLWAASSLRGVEYCAQAADCGMIPDCADIVTRLSIGQYMEIREICEMLIGALDDCEEIEVAA